MDQGYYSVNDLINLFDGFNLKPGTIMYYYNPDRARGYEYKIKISHETNGVIVASAISWFDVKTGLVGLPPTNGGRVVLIYGDERHYLKKRSIYR